MNTTRKAAVLNRVAAEVLRDNDLVATEDDQIYFFVDRHRLTKVGAGVVLCVSRRDRKDRILDLTKEQEIKVKLCWIDDPNYRNHQWLGADLEPDLFLETTSEYSIPRPPHDVVG